MPGSTGPVFINSCWTSPVAASKSVFALISSPTVTTAQEPQQVKHVAETAEKTLNRVIAMTADSSAASSPTKPPTQQPPCSSSAPTSPPHSPPPAVAAPLDPSMVTSPDVMRLHEWGLWEGSTDLPAPGQPSAGLHVLPLDIGFGNLAIDVSTDTLQICLIFMPLHVLS